MYKQSDRATGNFIYFSKRNFKFVIFNFKISMLNIIAFYSPNYGPHLPNDET